jgi:acetyl-CoA carboxylase carboxyltransferase component
MPGDVPATFGRVTTIGLRAQAPGAARAMIAELGDRRVVQVEVDASTRRGALTAVASETIAQAAATALAERIPFVCLIGSSGADILEGISALHGWGTAAKAIASCSGIVPLLAAVTGPAVSGPALLLGLADHVVLTQDAYAFVSGPQMVAEFTGVVVTNDELGGASAHARSSGVASLVVTDREAALEALAEILQYLPQHGDELPHPIPTHDPVDRAVEELRTIIPASPTGSYDIRDVLRALADDGIILEVRDRWAPNIVTAYGTIGGRPVGFVADQPLAIAGTLDIPSSQKAARFVEHCDSFNLPIVTVVDTPGFYPGKDLEWRGMIRHGAQLVFAYGRATVPRVCVILRKSYGGAYIVMDSKTMGNDICFAWPTGELAVMGAKGAVEILHRRASPEERLQREREYDERFLNPYLAAERGYVDAVIDPAETRREVAAALAMLEPKRESLPGRKHDNGPL